VDLGAVVGDDVQRCEDIFLLKSEIVLWKMRSDFAGIIYIGNRQEKRLVKRSRKI
jgi:hypothetical protein